MPFQMRPKLCRYFPAYYDSVRLNAEASFKDKVGPYVAVESS
jgi:hypothetical protein